MSFSQKFRFSPYLLDLQEKGKKVFQLCQIQKFIRKIPILMKKKQVNVHEVMRSIFNIKSDYNITDSVAISFEKMWYSGEITDIENNDMKVKCMKRHGRNTFTLSEDHYWYKGEEILCKISAPSPLKAGFFSL
ncbi:hypothetical protein AVEN_170896-1 [Araneus ventricosus]|uniref:Uncharacterized protein n=1 Tax=Araneus ventricosus TaxID=182803 RepID=A0A4Y2B7H7_ARAVE|nr:hypothetical protein AVEN_170896-1 [Araneus ventricosus]